MPKSVSRLTCIFFCAAAFMAICAGVWLVGVLVLGIPQANTRLGQPSPALNPVLRNVLSGYLLVREGALDSPAGEVDASITLVVQEGDTAAVVIDQLALAGVVHDELLLRSYLRYRGYDLGVEAGQYQLYGSMTVREIAETLQTARPLAVVFTLLEGWRIEEIAAAIEASELNISASEFIVACTRSYSGYSFTNQLSAVPSLEGFLFPDTYFFDYEAGVTDVVEAILDNFEAKVGSDLRSGFENHGLSLFEAVTLASIIEREAVIADERPIIASVFLNRLALEMKLEADPTVQYALGFQASSWWKSPLTLDDLAFDSPYNTYLYPGLPPGPIASPGYDSLRAVAFPAESAYLYFRALCDGSGRHAFAQTFEEHLQNACP